MIEPPEAMPTRDPHSSSARRPALLIAVILAAAVSATGCAHDKSATELHLDVPDADRDAEVYVDGNYMGIVEALDGQTGAILLGPGVHRVEVRKPGRFPVQRTVTVERRPQAKVVIEAELLEDPQ